MNDNDTFHRMDGTDPRPGRGLIVTIDVEDHTLPPSMPRLDGAIAPILDLLCRREIHATFFVVGELVESSRELLHRLMEDGHELGLHGFTHRYLRDLGPVGFADELRCGVDAFHDHLGITPTGFRAPYCSITRDTPWAPDLLTEAGFHYSSSVLPASNPIAGYPGAPRRPFRWPSGLIEIPVPVFGRGRLSVPALGGAYLRLAPRVIIRWACRGRSAEAGDWTYAHPYDFDLSEPFFRRPGQAWLEARLLFARRRLMLARFDNLMNAGSPTLGDFAAGLQKSVDLPTFQPTALPA
jgi:peptidoglycan/xylan/chitin deacetylase (PgdA/CDA1 family)